MDDLAARLCRVVFSILFKRDTVTAHCRTLRSYVRFVELRERGGSAGLSLDSPVLFLRTLRCLHRQPGCRSSLHNLRLLRNGVLVRVRLLQDNDLLLAHHRLLMVLASLTLVLLLLPLLAQVVLLLLKHLVIE